MQQLANSNTGIRYLFVAVDILSRYLWVGPIKVKTAHACREALKKTIARNDKSPKPKICHETHQPEKIWVDKGREFSGEFSTFCSQKGIEIYSTKSETKSALAERNIRSLKSLIFKYMHEHDQSRYFDKLDQLVAIINNRVNRMTKLAPISVSQKDDNYLVSLCHTNAQKSQNSKLATKFALGARLTHFIEVTRYNSQKNCLQLRQYQQTTPQLILSGTATGNLYKENFTNLNSCDSLQTDLVNNGQAIRN